MPRSDEVFWIGVSKLNNGIISIQTSLNSNFNLITIWTINEDFFKKYYVQQNVFLINNFY